MSGDTAIAGGRVPEGYTINLDALRGRCMGNDDIAIMVLRKFIDQLGTGEPSLTSRGDAASSETISATAHRLRGAAASLGADRLAQVLAAVEKAPRDQGRTEAQPTAEVIGEAIRSTRAGVELALAQLAAARIAA